MGAIHDCRIVRDGCMTEPTSSTCVRAPSPRRRASSWQDAAYLLRAFRPRRMLSAPVLAALASAPLLAQAHTVRTAYFNVTDRYGFSVDGETGSGTEGAAYKFSMKTWSRLAGSGAGGTVTMTTVPGTSATTYSFSPKDAESNRRFRDSFTPPTDAACRSSSWTVTLTATSDDPSIDRASASFTAQHLH